MPIGAHYLVEMYDCSPGRLTDASAIVGALRDAAARAGLTWLDEAAHAFERAPDGSGGGVTAIGLLSESHISVHTWPEIGYAAMDLFTCSSTARGASACDAAARALGAGRVEIRRVDRGGDIEHATGAPGKASGDDEHG